MDVYMLLFDLQPHVGKQLHCLWGRSKSNLSVMIIHWFMHQNLKLLYVARLPFFDVTLGLRCDITCPTAAPSVPPPACDGSFWAPEAGAGCDTILLPNNWHQLTIRWMMLDDVLVRLCLSNWLFHVVLSTPVELQGPSLQRTSPVLPWNWNLSEDSEIAWVWISKI